MARRRGRRRNDGAGLLAGIVVLSALLFRNVNFGQILFVLFVILLISAILAGLYYLLRTAPEPAFASPSSPPPRSQPPNSPQSISDFLGSAAGAEEDEEPESPRCWSLEVLRSLEWKRFETVCAVYLRMIGLEPEETRIGADGGVDIRVYRPGKEKPVGIVQCKAWSSYKVGVKPVRELYGVMAAEGITTGKFITSGEFTREALEFAEGKKLRLISGERFLAAIRKLSEEKQQALLEEALEGDYRTPTCPQCGIKMKVRQGRNGGRQFWGCVRYPRCRATLVFKAEDSLGMTM